MSHAELREGPAPSRRSAGPLDLVDTVHREWDIVMTRDGRWARVIAGITDPDEVHRQLAWYRLSNRSVAFHVVERTTTVHEELVDEAAVLRP